MWPLGHEAKTCPEWEHLASGGAKSYFFCFQFFYLKTSVKGSGVSCSFHKRLDLDTSGTRLKTAESPAEPMKASGRWLDAATFRRWFNSVFCFLPSHGRTSTSSTPNRTLPSTCCPWHCDADLPRAVLAPDIVLPILCEGGVLMLMMKRKAAMT